MSAVLEAQSPSPAAKRQGKNAEALAQLASRERQSLLALTVPALLIVGCVVLIPMGWLFWLSIVGQDGLTLDHYERLLHPSYRLTLSTTFQLAFLVTGICLVLGYPLAYLAAQLPPRAASLVLICVLFPFWTSLLVRTYAWLVLLQRRGIVNNFLLDLGLIDQPLRLVHNMTGTVIGMVHVMLPFLVLPLYASMRAIDPGYLRAASNLGASPTRAFWQIFFPLSMPGLVAGLILTFILCLGFYITPAILGGGRVQMIAQRVEASVSLYPTWGPAAALGVVLLVLTVAFLLLSRFILVRLNKRLG